MPTNTPCTCAPEIAHALAEVHKLAETLEHHDRSVPGNAALRLTYLAMHALERAGAICRDEIPPTPTTQLDGGLSDLDDFIYIASSLIDPRGPDAYDSMQSMKGALRAMLTPSLGEMGLTITPEA